MSSIGRPILRKAEKKDGPVITDNGNFIINLFTSIENPKSMEKELNCVPGILENGIFTSKCEAVLMKNGKIEVLKSR